MKLFVLLFLFSLTAYADIDCYNTNTGENHACDAEKCIESAGQNPEKQLYQAMNCPNILRIADIVAGENSDFGPAIDSSDRRNTKTDLPDINDYRESTSATTSAQ